MKDRFAAIYTAAVADILDARGNHDQTLPHSIVRSNPGRASPGLPTR